jgi:methionine synthase I (cobalamin-dependent)
MNQLRELVDAKGYAVLDGAMGTQLFAAGLTSGDPPERWNIEFPERIQKIHRDYYAAGSDVVLTNSFGGTRYRLMLHSLEDQVAQLSEAAAANARIAADETGRNVLVAGSMGPTGELIEPLGSLTTTEAEAAFAEQARGLEAGGADLLWLETLSDLAEVEAAVRGAQSVSDLPVVATMSYDTAGRTMMGVTAAEAVQRLAPYGLAGLGANCGSNIADTEAAVTEIARLGDDLLVVSKANAGIPEWHGTELHYNGTPEVLAAHAYRVRTAGVKVIGGCCGSTPAHVEMIAKVLSGEVPVPEVEVGEAFTPATVDRDSRRASSSRRRRRATS